MIEQVMKEMAACPTLSNLEENCIAQYCTMPRISGDLGRKGDMLFSKKDTKTGSGESPTNGQRGGGLLLSVTFSCYHLVAFCLFNVLPSFQVHLSQGPL
jgi:hypothetical protein